MRSFIEEVKDILKDAFSRGKLTSVGVIVFKSNRCMWDFLKKCSGYRFSHKDWQLCHSIEKAKLEREWAKRVSKGAKMMGSHVTQASGLSDDNASAKSMVAEGHGLHEQRGDGGTIWRTYTA